ncbi:hypothetical protein SLE2022_018520 [Rubroshorea leprosula]
MEAQPFACSKFTPKQPLTSSFSTFSPSSLAFVTNNRHRNGRSVKFPRSLSVRASSSSDSVLTLLDYGVGNVRSECYSPSWFRRQRCAKSRRYLKC